MADPAEQVYFRRRLSEGEVVRPQARADVVAEHRPGPQIERAAEVAHRQPAVDRESLDLMEHGRVRRVQRVVAVDAAGDDDVTGSAALEQRSDLHR